MEPTKPDSAQSPDCPTVEPSEIEPPEAPVDAAETLSPSVRRLVKQYGLDVANIRGSGPGGRIRVADVMAVLGSHTAPPEDEPMQLTETRPDGETSQRSYVQAAPWQAPAPAPVTTVFECNMAAALAHRKQMLARKAEFLLTSYYLQACVEALRAVPEANGGSPEINIAVALSDNDGCTVAPVIHHADALDLPGINDCLREVHQRLRVGRLDPEEQQGASFVVYHHGLTGSLLATPTPLGDHHSASLGVGKIRRHIEVQNVSGQTGPRIAPICYVSLSFDPGRLDIHRANRFLAHFVATLERWPQPG